jgi:RNA polymerase sigma-70 factor (ECF subfamily)
MANELRRSPATENPERLRKIAGGAETSDAELLRGAGRDPEAFRDFYQRYGEEILGYFGRRTGDRDSALELAAETFSQVWMTRERFEDRHQGSAAPWLFGIARNVLLMSIRRGSVERSMAAKLGVIERLDLGGAEYAAPEAAWAEGADELLNSLPLSQREALRLRIVDELTYDEVAAALGTSRSAARVRVHRALAALRRRLSNQDGEQR